MWLDLDLAKTKLELAQLKVEFWQNEYKFMSSLTTRARMVADSATSEWEQCLNGQQELLNMLASPIPPQDPAKEPYLVPVE